MVLYMTGAISKARQIARYDLESCSTPDGIIAGGAHFTDLWARDSLFASLGAPKSVADCTIRTFLRFQRSDGAVPYRIFRKFGVLIPNFRSVQSGGFVPDGGLMLAIASPHHKKKILAFYKERYGDNLISEWFQCEWADAVLKIGKVLYTNILYWKATGDNKIARKINTKFWNGTYFSDWVDYKRQDYFAAHPNMLAIIWGLTTKKQAEKILAYARNKCWNGWALEENYPQYPWWRIPLQNYIAGIPDYHNRGVIWLQPAILYALALYKTGHTDEARLVLGKVAQKIIEYKGVYEIYEKSGQPVSRFFYKAEYPFAWSSGLFLRASKIIGS